MHEQDRTTRVSSRSSTSAEPDEGGSESAAGWLPFTNDGNPNRYLLFTLLKSGSARRHLSTVQCHHHPIHLGKGRLRASTAPRPTAA